MRFPLWLAALCTVQAMTRVKRATTGASGNAATAANNTEAAAKTGVVSSVYPAGKPAGARHAPAPARRANDVLQLDMKPIDLHVRKKSKDRETSSSSGAIDAKEGGDGGADKESLDLSDNAASDSDKGKKGHSAPPSDERTGWRKWHRKCTPCPEEMNMKWRDPRIKWVCGAYQRARRSFKSLCMMRYRNCQDGTMFVFIHPHRCANSTPDDSAPHGEHFMYDYQAKLSDDSSNSKDESSSESDASEKSSSESE